MTNLIHKYYKYIFPVLLLVVLVGGLFIGIRLARERQVAPRATVGAGSATLAFSGPASVAVGQDLPVDVGVYAPETVDASTTDGIIGVKVVFNFDNTILSLSQDRISGNLPGWTYAREEVVANGNTSTVIIEAIYLNAGQDGYMGSAVGTQTLASLNFGTHAAGSVNLAFDTGASDIRSKENLPVLSSSLSGSSYTVGSSATVAPTDTPLPTATIMPGDPTNTPVPTNTPGPTATPGPGGTNACGGTCGSSANCNSGLTCYGGFCRNPACVTAVSCSCPGAPTATPTLRPTTPPGVPTSTNAPVATPTTEIIAFSEPTQSDNPLLGGAPRTNVDIPDITYESEAPAEPENWWETLLRIITDFLKIVFGFR